MTKDSNDPAVPSGCNSEKAVSRDWIPFTENLTIVLSRLAEDQFLIILAKIGNRFIQFACQGAWGMRVEVSSNHFLEGDDELTHHQTDWLVSHGWNPPTGRPHEAIPERDPDGSPNYYIDFPTSANVADIAQIAVDAMVNALDLPYPSAMAYEARDTNGDALAFPELGLKFSVGGNSSLMDQVLATFRTVTGIDDLELDEDGDVIVTYGSIQICAVQLDNKVRVYSALITEVSESAALLWKLNRINDGKHRLRCFLHEETVFAAFDVSAAPFVAEHLAAGISEFSEVAEGLAIALRAEFAGNAIDDSSGAQLYLQ